MKKKLLLVFILSIFFIPNVKAADLPAKNEILDEYQQAVRDVAYGFYYRGLDKTLLYDQYNINYSVNDSGSVGRTDNRISPEDITEQDIHYHMCSSYVWNVYYEAFKKSNGDGYNLGGLPYDTFITRYKISLVEPSSSIKQVFKINGEDVTKTIVSNNTYYNQNMRVTFSDGGTEKVLYYTNKNNEGSLQKLNLSVEDRTRIRNEIYNNIQPGDIVVTLVDNNGSAAGHAMLYIGNGTMLDSSGGGSYNLANKTNKTDTVQMGKFKLSDLLADSNTNSARKVFSPWTTAIAIIRPLNEVRNSEYIISSKTRSRMTYNELVSTKLASVNKYDSVNPGDEITYTIRLENRSETKDYSNISITDKIPDNTEFVKITGNGTNNNGNLSWTVSVPKGQTKTISYTVKVKDDNSLLDTSIVSDKTSVGGISLKKITTLVKRTLTKDEQNSIKNKVKDGDSYSSSEEFINTIYPGFGFKNPNDMLNIFYDNSSITYNGSNIYYRLVAAKNIQTNDVFNIFKLKKDTSITDDNKVFYNMYVSGLFGGAATSNPNGNYPKRSDGRSIFYNTNTLMVGDVLVMYDEDYQTDTYVTGEKNMYLYLGGSFASVKDGKVKVSTEQEGERLLESLICKNSFIVLIPSFSMKTHNNSSEIVVQKKRKNTSIIFTIVGGLIIVIGSLVLITKRRRVN